MSKKQKRDGISNCLVMVLGGIFHMYISGYVGYNEYIKGDFSTEINFELIKTIIVSLVFGTWFVFSIIFTFIYLKSIFLFLFSNKFE